MQPGYTNLNHGAFGSVCKPSLTAERSFFDQMEADCNIWFRGGYQPVLQQVRTRLAQYVNAQDHDLVLVENASSGVNAVLRSLADQMPLKQGDVILHMNIACECGRSACVHLCLCLCLAETCRRGLQLQTRW